MYEFQNRGAALKLLGGGPETQYPLINLYGERGLGKSRLIAEAMAKQKEHNPRSVILSIDIAEIAKTPNKPETLLRSLIEQAPDRLVAEWTKDINLATSSVVSQIIKLTQVAPVCITFDTTEALQEEMDFWNWLEQYLVNPLAMDGNVQLIFAGRIPVPWRRAEIRRMVKLYPLEPLPLQDDARKLTAEILSTSNPELAGEVLEQAIDQVLVFSFGHPLLSEVIAKHIAPLWPPADPEQFATMVATDIVKPFVDDIFLQRVEPDWCQILWWACILNWFDATVLHEFIQRVEPTLANEKPIDFYIRGLPRLRIRNTLIWRGEQGDKLHGVIGPVMKQCFRQYDQKKFKFANQKAAETMQALAALFPENDPDARLYIDEAEFYQKQANEA